MYQVLKLAAFMCFPQHVAATYELAVDIELRYGWPIRKLLDPFPQLIVVQHIPRFKRHICSIVSS
jgi:hypothetical protein